MLEFLLADANIPFAVAITLLLFLGIFEGVGTLLGLGIGSLLDTMVPDLPDMDSSHNLNIHDLGSQTSVTRLLGWLRVGRVPLLILLIIFLFWFGSIGYFLNYISISIMGIFLPKILSVPVTFFAALPATRTGGLVLEKVLPKDETSSVSIDSLIGRETTITIGEATNHASAEAKVIDEHGKVHYVMVMAEEGHGPFTTQDRLLLVRRIENNFIVIPVEQSE